MRLAFGGDNIGALRARRLDQAQRNDFRHHRDQQRALGMGGFGDRAQIADQAEHIRALHHDAGGLVIDQRDNVFGAARRDRRARDVAGQIGHGFHGLGIMRMQAAATGPPCRAGDALGHQHRFGGGGRAVIHRGVGHLHAGEQRHLGLEFEQILQRALRDFRLIGRVGGEKFRTLDQMIHRRRHMMPVGARAAEERRRPGRHILRRQLDKRALDFQLALRVRQVESGQRRHAPHCGTSRNSASMSGSADLRQHGAAVGRALEADNALSESLHELRILVFGHQLGEIRRRRRASA